MLNEMNVVEKTRLAKSIGCAPRVFLQVKGPKDSDWCTLNSQEYSTPDKKEIAISILNTMRDRWSQQGFFSDHVFRLAT